MQEIMRTYNLKFKLLTPLFIGSGDEIEPFQLVPLSESHFVRINEGELIQEFDEQERRKFWELVSSDNLVELRKFIVGAAKKRLQASSQSPRFVMYYLRSTKEFCKAYLSGLSSEEGLFPTLEFIRHPDGRHYIPGSSIKGAIRTALVNSFYSPGETMVFVEERKKRKNEIRKIPLNKDTVNKCKNDHIEPAILGYQFRRRDKIVSDLSLDPFRLLRVADVQIPAETHLILANCYNVSLKRGSQRSQIPMRAEVLFANVGFQTTLSIVSHSKIKSRFKKTLDKQNIVDACNSFYKGNFKSEIDRFMTRWNVDRMMKLSEKIDKMKPLAFLLRLGRFSHVENMTIHQLASAESTSRTLFEKKEPMGWIICILEECQEAGKWKKRH